MVFYLADIIIYSFVPGPGPALKHKYLRNPLTSGLEKLNINSNDHKQKAYAYARAEQERMSA